MSKLKKYDTEFELTVVKYEIEREYDWSEIRIAVKNRYMDYNDCCEMLQKTEVDEIIKALNDLIYDRIVDEKELYFLEPDLTMRLYPAHLSVPGNGCWYRTGHSTSDCLLDITIHFRDTKGVYIGEEWTITLNRTEIMKLLDGLEMESGKRKEPRETVGLVGVSFIGNWEDIYWYRYEGDALWSRRFVRVDHEGKEEYALVEYVRNYDIAHLPCELSELKDIISILPRGEEERKLSAEWEDRGNGGNRAHTVKMVFDGTEFSIERKDGEYRVIVHNDFVHYDKTHLFCYGDVQGITDGLAKLVIGELNEVTAVGTVDPDLTFVLYPKGAKVVRDEGDGFHPTDIQGNPLIRHYESNTMKIELDLCLNGVYGEQFFTMRLSEQETEEFAAQWAVKIGEE